MAAFECNLSLHFIQSIRRFYVCAFASPFIFSPPLHLSHLSPFYLFHFSPFRASSLKTLEATEAFSAVFRCELPFPPARHRTRSCFFDPTKPKWVSPVVSVPRASTSRTAGPRSGPTWTTRRPIWGHAGRQTPSEEPLTLRESSSRR